MGTRRECLRGRGPSHKLAQLLILLTFVRLFIYWEAAFCVVVGGVYLVSLFDIAIVLGVVALLFHDRPIHNKWLARFAISVTLLSLIQGLLAQIIFQTYRYYDIVISLLYLVVPFILYSLIPPTNEMIAFVRKLIAFALLWFSVQLVLGATGILVGLAGSLGLSGLVYYDVYEGFFRVNNTFGGATTGAHIAFLLLVAFLHLSRQYNSPVRRVVVLATPWGIIFTFSQAAWLAMLSLAGYWGLIQLKTKQGLQKVFFIVLAMGLVLTFTDVVPRLVSARVTEEDSIASLHRRVEKLRISWETYTGGEPFSVLFGTGLGTAYARSWRPVNTMPLLPRDWDADKMDFSPYYLGAPHNTYLVLLNELGLVGTSFVVAWLCFLLRLLVRRKSMIVALGILIVLTFPLNTETTILFTLPSAYIFAMTIWAGFVMVHRN